MDNISVPLLNSNSQTIEEIIRDYSPYKIPPNIELAKLHGKARRVCVPIDANSINESTLKCPCCALPIENEQIELKCHPDKLSHLGVCFPLYFSYIKFCFAMLCLCIAIAGIANLVLNLQGSNCERIDNSFICRLSFLNLLDTDEGGVTLLRKESLFNVVAIVIMIIAFEVYRYRQRRFAHQHKEKFSIVNFSLMLSFLPRHFTREDIQNFINHYLEKMGKPAAKVLKVYFLYQLGEYANLYIDKKTLLAKRHYKLEKYEEYTTKLQEINKQLKEVERLYGEAIYSDEQSKVIIVLENSQSVRAILDYFKKRIFYQVAIGLHHYFGFSLLSENDLYHGAYIKVSKAPEPSDITWENLSYPSNLKNRRRFVTAIVASVLIIIGFIALSLLKKMLQGVQQDESGTTIGPYVSVVISLLSATCVAITNTLLGICIRKCMRYEKHDTHTDFFKGVGRRLTAVFVFNMSITTILANVAHYSGAVHAVSWDYFMKLSVTGLFYDVFFLFITNCYMSSIFNFFDIMWGLKLNKRRKAIKSGPDCKLTQLEANSLFEGHPVDLALRFANVNKTLIFTGLFAPFIPVGLIFSLVGFVIVYWIDKYLLLRRYVSAYKLSYSLPKAMLNTSEWFIVAYSLGNLFIFFTPLSDSGDGFVKPQFKSAGSYFWLSLAAFLLALSYKLFIPADFVHKHTARFREPREDVWFETVDEQLPEHYDNFNPLCRKLYREEHEMEDEEENEKIDLHDLTRTTPSTSVKNSLVEKKEPNIELLNNNFVYNIDLNEIKEEDSSEF